MTDKYDEFYSLAGKHISVIEDAVGVKFAGIVVDELGQLIVSILDEGYEISRKDNDVIVDLEENEMYRKGCISSFDGVTVSHQSSTYVKITDEQGDEYEFNLRNLPNFSTLDEFRSGLLSIENDSDVSAVTEQDKGLSEAFVKVKSWVEILYWRKVARSIQLYHKENQQRGFARQALFDADFSEHEVDNLIPLINVVE